MTVYKKGRFYHYDFMVGGTRYAGSTKKENAEEASEFERQVRATAASSDIVQNTAPRIGRFVYFIQGEVTRLIKIGFAVDVETRLATLSTGSPDLLRLLCHSEGTQMHEATMHRLLSKDRAHGEWFHPTADVLEVVELARQYPMHFVINAFIADRAPAK